MRAREQGDAAEDGLCASEGAGDCNRREAEWERGSGDAMGGRAGCAAGARRGGRPGQGPSGRGWAGGFRGPLGRAGCAAGVGRRGLLLRVGLGRWRGKGPMPPSRPVASWPGMPFAQGRRGCSLHKTQGTKPWAHIHKVLGVRRPIVAVALEVDARAITQDCKRDGTHGRPCERRCGCQMRGTHMPVQAVAAHKQQAGRAGAGRSTPGGTRRSRHHRT